MGGLWLSGEVKGHARSQPLGQKISAAAGATVGLNILAFVVLKTLKVNSAMLRLRVSLTPSVNCDSFVDKCVHL